MKMNNQIKEHVIWWNSLTEDKRQEINKLHFTCESGKESDFDIHRAFVNLVIKQEQEHLFWWNSLSIEKRDKLSQTYFQSEKSLVLSNVEILHIYEKINRHETFVNVNKLMEEPKIDKLEKVTGHKKYLQDRKDFLTTMLGLSQCLIYMFDQLSEDKSIFRHELKRTGKPFMNELEKTMNIYFGLQGQESLNQSDLVNMVVFWVEHGVKVAYRSSEMTEETCKSLIKDYKEFTDKFGIENKFIDELEKDFLKENNEQK